MLLNNGNVVKCEMFIIYRSRENHVSPKTRHTDRQTNISNYRVASLLKMGGGIISQNSLKKRPMTYEKLHYKGEPYLFRRIYKDPITFKQGIIAINKPSL